MNKKQPQTFDDVQNDGSLRWEVQRANWRDTGKILDIENEAKNANRELHDLLQEIGLTVIDGEQPDIMDVNRAGELRETIKRLRLQKEMIRDQARAAMREKLASILPPESVEAVSDSDIDDFYDNLEKASHAQMWLGRMLKNGLEY